MANAKRTVKTGSPATQHEACPTCGAPLNVASNPLAERKSPRAILMRGILAALDEGPASPREIESRMGVKPTGQETATMCRVLERRKEIYLLGERKTASRGKQTFVWARVPMDRRSSAQQPQDIERTQPNQRKSPRGARA